MVIQIAYLNIRGAEQLPIKTKIIDGVKYSTYVKKDAVINFSEAQYTVKMWEDPYDPGVELIPDNIDLLREITDVFPFVDYDIKIKQNIFRNLKPHVSLDLKICDKTSGEPIYFAESVILSDKDYDYMRSILMKDAPQYDWQTAEEYLKSHIRSYMCDGRDFQSVAKLFTDKAWDDLTSMVLTRCKEFKTDGYVDFDADLMEDIERDILEDALCRACNSQKESNLCDTNSFKDSRFGG